MDLYVVTGASRGLGRALVEHLCTAPETRVLAISRSGMPAGVHAGPVWRDVRADLATDTGQIAAAQAIESALAAEKWGRAVLINNAGVVEPLAVTGRADPAQIQRSIAVNLTAAVVLMNAFLGAARDVATRRVINISSGAGRRPMIGSGSYCAAKAGMDMVSRVAALEAESAGAGVTITSLAPGIIETDMQVLARGASDEQFPSAPAFRAFKAQNLLKTPVEVAERIIALERTGKLPAGIADVRELS
jgi:NAD(P)-dependent dehydrogenase (short-subunit alcohol dehydrogenase family)